LKGLSAFLSNQMKIVKENAKQRTLAVVNMIYQICEWYIQLEFREIPMRSKVAIKRATAVLLVAVMSGCGSVGVTKLKASLPRPSGCDLQVYSSAAEVGRRFEVVCLIDSLTPSNAFADRTAAGAINRAKPFACECGADGMIVESLNTQSTTAFGWGSGTAILKAIRYTDGSGETDKR
jgi:hypothetical protein